MAKASERRRTVRREEIADALRKDIVSGRYPPGVRLPTRAELRRRFATTPVTVQRAMDRLRAEGFAEPRGRSGSFVTDRPPHRYRVALVFPAAPDRPDWSLFHNALARAAGAGRDAVDFQPYFMAADFAREPADTTLLEDARRGRMAGALFAAPPYWLDAGGSFPRPAVAFRATSVRGVPAIATNRVQFFDRAAARLKACGRRRVAVLGTLYRAPRNLPEVFARHGLDLRPEWVLPRSGHQPEVAPMLVRLLMSGGNDNRPDGLLVLDDHLAGPAAEALATAGCAPEDLDVIAHANFPELPPVAFPVQWLGYDAQSVLCIAADILNRLRRGTPVPSLAQVPAVFEEEWRRAAPAPAAAEVSGKTTRGQAPERNP